MNPAINSTGHFSIGALPSVSPRYNIGICFGLPRAGVQAISRDLRALRLLVLPFTKLQLHTRAGFAPYRARFNNQSTIPAFHDSYMAFSPPICQTRPSGYDSIDKLRFYLPISPLMSVGTIA